MVKYYEVVTEDNQSHFEMKFTNDSRKTMDSLAIEYPDYISIGEISQETYADNTVSID